MLIGMSSSPNLPPPGFYGRDPSAPQQQRKSGGTWLIIAAVLAIPAVLVIAGASLGAVFYLSARSSAEEHAQRALAERRMQEERARAEERRLRAEHEAAEAEARANAERGDDATRQQLVYELDRAKAEASVARATRPGATPQQRCEGVCGKEFLGCSGDGPHADCHDRFVSCSAACTM